MLICVKSNCVIKLMENVFEIFVDQFMLNSASIKCNLYFSTNDQTSNNYSYTLIQF